MRRTYQTPRREGFGRYICARYGLHVEVLFFFCISVGDNCAHVGGTARFRRRTYINFAAGMTGGVVFAYDPDRALEARLNTELVAIGGLTEEDEARVLQLLIDHRAATDSALAGRLLEHWHDTVTAFCRVAPKAAGGAIAARPFAVAARLRA